MLFRSITLSLARRPVLRLKLVPGGKKLKTEEDIVVDEFIAVKGFKARGKRLSIYEVESVEWLEPIVSADTPDNDVESHHSELQVPDSELPAQQHKNNGNRDIDDDSKNWQITLNFD